MANIKSAVKRAKQADAAHKRNKAGKSRVLTARKKVLEAVESGNKEAAVATFSEYTSILDKNAKKKIIAKNNASRKKARMAAKIAALA